MDKNLDTTPDNFSSYDAAAEFWDTHDTTDYLNEFRTIETSTQLRARHFEIEIDEDVARALQNKAAQQGVTVAQLASSLLRDDLSMAA